MNTLNERTYQAALLSDAAYVTFQGEGYLDEESWRDPKVKNQLRFGALTGTASSDEVPFGEVDEGRGWVQSRSLMHSPTGI